jgi:hypothetical protein
MFGIDGSARIVVVHLPTAQHSIDVTDRDVVLQAGSTRIDIGGSHQRLNYTETYDGQIDGVNYAVYFTRLPILNILPTEEIVDEPKRLARLTYGDSEQTYSSWCGIEIRGGFSQTFPKKTYDLELWKDEDGDDTDSEQFGDLRKDDDWILDALYNEPLRIRSNIAHKLWLDIHQPYYLAEEDDAKAGADVMYVELFLDGRYNGLYNLSEQVDRKQLQVKDYKDGIRGELYKAESHDNTNWDGVRSYDNSEEIWMGYEVKVPDPDETIDWSLLYDAIDLVANGDDEDFLTAVSSTVIVDNAMDYFIFLNVMRALDNTGKNIFIAKYNTDEPYFMVPWDLDAVMGTEWTGQNDGWTEGILSNNLFDRLLQLDPDDYREQLRQRYEGLRSGLLSDAVMASLASERFDQLTSEKVYERESLVHGNYAFSNNDLTYMVDWLDRRLQYLDEYFDTLTSTDDTLTADLNIWPNPADEIIRLSDPIVVGKRYHIYTIDGKAVLTGKVGFDYSIAVTDLQNGLYVLRIDGRSAAFTVAR